MLQYLMNNLLIFSYQQTAAWRPASSAQLWFRLRPQLKFPESHLSGWLLKCTKKRFLTDQPCLRWLQIAWQNPVNLSLRCELEGPQCQVSLTLKTNDALSPRFRILGCHGWMYGRLEPAQTPRNLNRAVIIITIIITFMSNNKSKCRVVGKPYRLHKHQCLSKRTSIN